MSVYSVTGVLSVGDVAGDTGYSAIDLPSDQLAWLVGADDVVAAATMSGLWPRGLGLRVPVPVLFLGAGDVVLPDGLTLKSHQNGVAVIVAERDVYCPVLQYVYRVPVALVAAESDYAWLSMLSPEARIHAALALGPSPTIGEIASLPMAMTSISRLSSMSYDLVGDLIIRAGSHCSAVDMFASFSFGATVSLDSIAVVCRAHKRGHHAVSPRAKFVAVVEQEVLTASLTSTDWKAVSSQNRAFATFSGLSVTAAHPVEVVLADCPLANSYQLVLPDGLAVIVGGEKRYGVVTVFPAVPTVFVSTLDLIDISFIAQVDLDPLVPRYDQLSDYIDSGQFKRGYCYLSIVRPEYRLRVARDLGPWPKLSRILVLSMAWCLPLSDIDRLTVNAVGASSSHLLLDEGGGCVSSLAGVIFRSQVVFELGTFGSVLSRMDPLESALSLSHTVGGVDTLADLAYRWFRDKGLSDGFAHVNFSLEWLRSAETEIHVDVGRRCWMSEVGLAIFVQEVDRPEHLSPSEFVVQKTLAILPYMLGVFSDFPIELSAIDKVRLFYVSVSFMTIEEPRSVRALLRDRIGWLITA